jgi:hypothetical protein
MLLQHVQGPSQLLLSALKKTAVHMLLSPLSHLPLLPIQAKQGKEGNSWCEAQPSSQKEEAKHQAVFSLPPNKPSNQSAELSPKLLRR